MAKQTRSKNLEKGKKTQFSKTNQPSPEAKSAGHKKKVLFKEIAEAILKGQAKETFQAIADWFGYDVEAIDLETAMHLRQMEKAVLNGDTAAYNAVMDRLKGKPVQALQVSDYKPKPTGFRVIGKDDVKPKEISPEK